MKYFLAVEFMEQENPTAIALLDVGIVAEDGREYYAIHASDDLPRWCHGFEYKCAEQIAWEIGKFVGNGIQHTFLHDKHEFWSYSAAFRWVAMCQLFGKNFSV